MVLLDANALFLPFRSKLALRQEIERLRPGAVLRVPTSVLRELDLLVARGVRHAALARAFASTVVAIETSGRGDAAVVRAACANGAWVVTADRPLARRLREVGVSVLVPRDRTRLELRSGTTVPPRGRPALARLPGRRGSRSGNG